eukprot:symbB.v1.2.023318.t1/scaffold2123.1/size88534/3
MITTTRHKSWRSSLHFFSHLSLARLEVSTVSVNAVLAAFASHSRWRNAVADGAMFKASNSIGCNSAVNACVKGRSWRQALCLATSTECPERVDDGTMVLAVVASKEGLQWKMAMMFLSSIHEAGKNTLSAYGAAISCSPDWQQALQILDMLQVARLQANYIIFSAAIGAPDGTC